MSVGQVAVSYTGRGASRRPEDRHPLLQAAHRFTPREGWDSFALLAVTMGVVAFTVREAGWVETPGLLLIVLLSVVTGLLLAKSRAAGPVLFIAGLAVGYVIVAWQTASLVKGQSVAGRWSEMSERLGLWYQAAAEGGISTDLLPFTFVLLSFAWLLGFVSSWFLFRRGNVWVGSVLGGVAILTNLSFLPEGFSSRFFLFMLLAMLLVARIGILKVQDQWRQAMVGFSPNNVWLGLRAAAVLSVAVLLLAAVVPLKVYVSTRAVNVWNFGRTPIASVEDHFGRLFSGISSRKDLAGRFFGTTLPFQGKISFGGDVVIRASTEYPTYWLSRTYSKYASEGWFAGKTDKIEVGRDSLPPPPQESFDRVPVAQALQLNFETYNLFSGGNLEWISRDAVAETLAPLEFEINVLNPALNAELPADVRDLAEKLRQEVNSPEAPFGESQIARMLPIDLILLSVHPDSRGANSSSLQKVTVARKAPSLPDIVTWKFADRFDKDDVYTMSSLVSRAEVEDLRAAGTNYGGFLRDHYLQLPNSLPQRVRDLAADLSREAETPLDKAVAIQQYLREDDKLEAQKTLTYSQDIRRPPRGADGVDHFLFESKTGYSDYYASSMAVMLRSVGVPARLAAGYAPGDSELGAGVLAVKDSDSHAWVQAYFPGHGWIDFEPTPHWPLLKRGDPEEDLVTTDLPVTQNEPLIDEDDCVLAELDPAAEDIVSEECLEELGLNASEDSLRGPEETPSLNLIRLLVQLLIALVVIGGLWAMAWFVWEWGLGRATPAERAYTKMGRLAGLAGIGRKANQTSIEYGVVLGRAVPVIASGANTVAWAYAAGTYARERPADGGEEGDLQELAQAWRSVRISLVSRIFKRLALLGRV